jgi:hypothetical protein
MWFAFPRVPVLAFCLFPIRESLFRPPTPLPRLLCIPRANATVVASLLAQARGAETALRAQVVG